MNRVRPGRRGLPLFAVACLVATALAFPLSDNDIAGMAVVFTLSWLLCLALLILGGHGAFYRPSVTWLVLFGLFHGGLLMGIALRGPDGFTAYDSSWLYSGYTGEAVRLAIFGMAVFTLAAELAAGRPGRAGDREGGLPMATLPVDSRPAFAMVGLVAESAGVVIFAWTVVHAGGLGLLSGGYLTFLQAGESEGGLGYATFLIGVGAVLAVIGGGRARTTAWIVFSGYAVVAFLIGTRGAVLFPLLALLAVEVREGRRIRTLWTVLTVPAVLILIGLVRTTRLTGFGSSVFSIWAAPLDAIAEMGYSLRPSVVVLGWHAAEEPFRHGVTFAAVPLRFVEAVTGLHGGPPVYDDRLFNVEILHRVGPIGGSPLAEAYHNAGIAGIVLFMVAAGVVLGRLEQRPLSPSGNALTGIVLLPLLIQTRNSFAPVPAQIAVGLLLLWLVRMISRRADKPVLVTRC